MNKTLHRSQWAIAVGLLASLTSGCATSTVGLVSGPFSQESLAERRMSAAQTPIARSNAIVAEKKRAESGSYNAPARPQELSDIALASYNAGPPGSGNAMASGNAERPVESFAVPREPIGMPLQTIDPTVPAVGSPYRLTGHGRPILGGHAAPNSQGECTSCGIGQRYRPMFPQIHGSCGTAVDGSCSTDCGPACGPECAPEMRCADPQEYIFDGGDRDPQVRIRDDMSQSGLDPEDTVIQYTTANGQTLVQSGCRVAIYAPRFASVRKRTGPMTADLALRPQTSVLPDGPGVVREQLPPVNIVQPVRPIAKDAVRVVEAFRERQRPLPTDWVLPMGELSDAFKPFEDLDLIRSGDLLGTDPAKLALAAAAARIWSNVDQLKVLIDGQEAVVVTDLKQPQEVLTYEFKGARIRLCKVASEQIAHPGDVISFTIRFDNVGDSPLKNLVVTDSLAPRLEYVDASQQSSLPASFSATPNEAGSKVLRWELDNPIKPGEGGIVRFDAKVR
ncbi:MAG: DUF11 domain-containing protein [Pirellula sp.]|nr:DUF11 domain-containing protein [Pirellula sp.]